MENMENHSTTNRLIIVEWLTLAAIFVGCFLFLHSEMKGINCNLQDRMLAQEHRTDRLYEMFIELVKEKRG